MNVLCPVTGNMWKITKSVGAKVASGEEIAILESMKMEIPVEAPSAGTIAEWKVKEGASCIEGAVLAVIA